MFTRMKTRPIFVKNLQIGGQNQVIIQSMTNTKTKDIQATIHQIRQLETAGCQLIRVAVLDMEDAKAIRTIVEHISIPLVADIHFDYRLALSAIEHGAAKIRLNPGNIANRDHIRQVVEMCKTHKVPIRIGINSGSLEKRLLEKYGAPCSNAMIESAQDHIAILNEYGFDDIALSFKSSDVRLTIDAYRLAAKTFPYPLHLGVTEAGTVLFSAIKSSAALGALFADEIGDTIRISVSDDPIEEIKIAKQLLKSFDLIRNVPDLISCPTCGRLQYDMIPIVKEIESYIADIKTDITIAIMGCAVNGPQEASRADIGIAGGKEEALLFSKGQLIRKVPQKDLVDTLKQMILDMTKLSD
ncbi:MAG: 4-hydroxy-3-methylbut-2-en-1-yl diphosphate synthase [Firmicutes bacterium HGW-Firmicutes-19]|jgi:(E)-4-hydroxy-3-methylbut-2-enyl-diphosphate synthase|nr:MAG: 4-hydroxy-3-methylbut-2-en-1-yl diphosphate synthase [Firmicutes bacterium HGW-Firmicutes-19]